MDLFHHKIKIIAQTKDLVNYSQGVDYILIDYLDLILVNKIYAHFIECCMKDFITYPYTYFDFDLYVAFLEKHVVYSTIFDL